MTRPLVPVLALTLFCAASAQAQQPARGRISIAGGLEWMGGSSFGAANADEITASGAGAPLFATSSELTASAGAAVKIGVRLTRLFEIEADGAYLRPSIATRVTADSEGAPDVTATDRLRQFTVEGTLVYTLGRWRTRKLRPFLAGGGGYLRQLHEGDTLSESGRIFSAGGGARIPLATRSRGRLAAYGIRADARAVVRTKAAALDGGSHLSPSIGVSLYASF